MILYYYYFVRLIYLLVYYCGDFILMTYFFIFNIFYVFDNEWG